MKNKLLILFILLFLVSCTFHSGQSIDTVYSVDKGPLWSHLYLKDDHSTCYCFDNTEWYDMLKEGQKNGTKFVVSYETYLLTGGLCYCGEKFDTVVVTKIEKV